MEQRDSIDRTSSEAPVSVSTSTAHINAPGFTSFEVPASRHTQDLGDESSHIVEGVLQSDVGLEIIATYDKR